MDELVQVLILLDVLQPSNYGAEGDRVLWTLCGVGIAVLVMLLASLLAKPTAKAPPQPAPTGPGSAPTAGAAFARSNSQAGSPDTRCYFASIDWACAPR